MAEQKQLIINRIAVAVFFFVSGFLFASWSSRLPELQSFLDITHGRLGSILFSMAFGAIVAMPLTGWLTTKIGSDWTCRITSLMLCMCVCILPIFQNLTVVTFVFFMVGFSGGALDVAMNGQAVGVERQWGRSIMSSFHALFSIGMALGAGVAALIAKLDITLSLHLFSMTILALMLSLWASFNLLKDAPVSEEGKKEEGGFRLPTLAILPLGVVAFCGMLSEGSMIDWSALYMNTVVGGDEMVSALAVGTFATAMTIGRVFGDYFTDKLGRIKMLVSNSIVAICGLAFTLSFVSVSATLVGFFLVGLGLSNVVPIVYSAAGNSKGVSPSVGIAMASTIGYAGFFVGPPTIGFLADLSGLRFGLAFTLCILVLMLVLILSLKNRIRG